MRRRGASLVPLALLGLAGLLGCGSGAVPSRARLGELTLQGVSPDMVYVVELSGYEPAEPSMSLYNEEGFQAYYIGRGGRRVWLGVDRGAFSDALCPGRPVHEEERVSAPVTCERDEVGWYRVSGRRHEYALATSGRVIRLSGRRSQVDRAALKEAVAGVRQVHPGATQAP